MIDNKLDTESLQGKDQNMRYQRRSLDHFILDVKNKGFESNKILAVSKETPQTSKKIKPSENKKLETSHQ